MIFHRENYPLYKILNRTNRTLYRESHQLYQILNRKNRKMMKNLNKFKTILSILEANLSNK